MPSKPENAPERVYEPIPIVMRAEAEARLANPDEPGLVRLLLGMSALKDIAIYMRGSEP